MPQKYFSIDGVATFVHHTGATTLPGVAPDAPRGETIVCLHGAGGNGDQFAALLPKLAEQHSPLAFDQPAHGRSAGLDSLGSVERMVAFTAAFCAKLGLDRPVLLGHGLGAAVALQYALDRPDGVRALVLCAGGARSELSAGEVDHMRRVSEGKERRPFSKDLFAPDCAPELLRAGFMQGLKTDPRATYGDLRAAMSWNAEQRLGDVSLPTLVVRGEHERQAVVTLADALAAGIAGARTSTIPGAGHMLPIEQPDALAAAVHGFLEAGS